jgi:tRNA threonylcarbamoyl adenosine modification protein YeaZ
MTGFEGEHRQLRILAFDTSTAVINVCLMDSGYVVVGREIAPTAANRQEAVTMLVPSIDAALKEAGWEKQSLTCLVVGQGPGSFTGIRTAVVTAKTLAQALKLPLLGVSSLECYARQAQPPVAVVLSAAPGFLFAAGYSAGGHEQVPPAYLSREAAAATLKPFARWLADDAARQQLAPEASRCEPLPVLKNIAVIEAQIAQDRLSLRVRDRLSSEERAKLAEEFTWRHVEPLYLRSPSVTVKKSNANQDQADDIK